MEGSVDETAKSISEISIDHASPTASGETMSKNARKKELKNKQKEEERKRKEEEKAKQVKKSAAADDEEMDPTQYFENRIKYLAAQKKEGRNLYPHKFFVSMSLIEYIEKYGSLRDGEHKDDVTVSMAANLTWMKLNFQHSILV